MLQYHNGYLHDAFSDLGSSRIVRIDNPRVLVSNTDIVLVFIYQSYANIDSDIKLDRDACVCNSIGSSEED
jgi:hypothetical protein